MVFLLTYKETCYDNFSPPWQHNSSTHVFLKIDCLRANQTGFVGCNLQAFINTLEACHIIQMALAFQINAVAVTKRPISDA
jgi:hypothetical protein